MVPTENLKIHALLHTMSTFVQQEEDSEEPENLWVACTNGDMARVRELLSQGFTVNQQDENGFSPMHAAASYGQVELLRELISLGGDVHLRDAEGDTPLLVCETPEVFEALLAAGADPAAVNTEGDGILQKVIEDDNEVMANYLAERGMAPQGFRFVSREAQEEDMEEWNPEEAAEGGEA